MRHDPQAGGAVPALSAADLAEVLPPSAPELVTEAVHQLPSSHFTVTDMWKIRERAAAWAIAPDVSGIVVTHGTDVLDETAYLLDLTISEETPLVITCAMRAASDLGAEGPANLWAAVRVANSLQARGLGAVLVANDEIHAARYATKMDTLSPSTFQSPGWGPIGRVEGDRVNIPFRVERDLIPCSALEQRIVLFKLIVGMEAHLLDSALDGGARGVVLEALGGGRIPPWWLPSIERAVADDVPVVIASRCPSGRVWDSYGYIGAHNTLREIGCLFSEGLSGQKACIRLMAALGAATDPAHVTRLWNGNTAG